MHTQGINVFRAPLTGNHHTLQRNAESDHGSGSGGPARSKEFVLLVTVSEGGWVKAHASGFFTTFPSTSVSRKSRPAAAMRTRLRERPPILALWSKFLLTSVLAK